tara:strand:+ start:30751 stop:32268 length:1518 start_codon:yes stop_codon:yes gene_type:complete
MSFSGPHAQGQISSELLVYSTSGTDRIPTFNVEGQEMLSLNALVPLIQIQIEENSRPDILSISTESANIILTEGQQVVSVNGRLISLRSAPRIFQGQWAIPLEFLERVLQPIYSGTFDFRSNSRVLVLEDAHVPKISTSYLSGTDYDRLTLEVTPATSYKIDQDLQHLTLHFDANGLDILDFPLLSGELVTTFEQLSESPDISISLGPTFDSLSVSSQKLTNGGELLSIDLVSKNIAAADASVEEVTSLNADNLTETLPTSFPDFSNKKQIRSVAIDPGHGGSDYGSQGVNGTNEKDITLAIALQLQQVIENRLGLDVILTRDRDETVDLDARAAIANNNKADLFISLHVNSSARPSAIGAEVFYLSIDEYSSEAQELAEHATAPVSVVTGGSRTINMLLWDVAQIGYVEQSAHLSSIVQNELKQRIAMNTQPIQQAPFRVLVGANMPAVLIELGSIYEPAEEYRLTSDRFQTAVVESLVASILKFGSDLDRWDQINPTNSQEQE